MTKSERIFLFAIVTLIIYSLIATFVFKVFGELLGCVDLSKKMIHIHTKSDPGTYPAYIGVPPRFGGNDTCVREIHTHTDDGWLHLESNNLTKTFMMKDFLDLWGKSPMEFSVFTVNNQSVNFDQPLKDQDQIVLK